MKKLRILPLMASVIVMVGMTSCDVSPEEKDTSKIPLSNLTCFLSEDEYYMFHKAARNYQTKRGKQIENQLKSILEHWKKDEFYDRDKM